MLIRTTLIFFTLSIVIITTTTFSMAEGENALQNIAYSISHADEALMLEPDDIYLISRHVQDCLTHANEAITLMPRDNMHGKLAVTHLKDAIRHLELAVPHGDQRHTAHGRESLKFAEKATAKVVMRSKP